MLSVDSVLATLKNPSSTFGAVSEEDAANLNWFIKLRNKDVYNLGYFVNMTTQSKLCFPSVEFFSDQREAAASDLFALYNSFAWKGFMHYCQPGIDSIDNSLTEFLYRGLQHLDPELASYMLRFPSSDWLDALLELNSVKPTDEIKALIEKNKLVSSRFVCADFKHVQSRLYALLYLLDHMAFVHRYYDDNFSSEKELITRSPEIIKLLLRDDAPDYIDALNNVDLFDSPITGTVLVVKIALNRDGTDSCSPAGELTYIDTNDRFTKFLPLFECFAFADGITDRINDMPNGAATLTVDFRKTGLTSRYATLNKSVMKHLYASTSMLKVNTRSHVDLGLDIFDDFGFKYWNLQSSIESARNYSAFSIFSLYGISSCNFEKLSQGILSADYELIRNRFRTVVNKADKNKLELIGKACGFPVTKPRLRKAILDYGEARHPSEVYQLIVKNKDLFQ